MSLQGKLDADVSSDDEATTVTFRFTVTNTGPDPVELEFSDACKADFVVRDDGGEVWRFTDGRMFAQVLSSETLDPDESATYDAEWDDPQSGTFTAVAELRARQALCKARTDFTV